MRLAIAAVAIAACGGGGSAVAPTPAAPKLEAVDPRKAESDARGLVTEIYESLGHGDTDSLQTLLAPAVTVFGPRRTDAVGKREDAIVALGKLVDAKSKTHVPLRTTLLGVTPSPGGHSAVAFDIVNVGPDPLVVLAVLSNADDLWLVDAAALANAPPEKEIKQKLKEDAVVPPGATGVAKLDGNARAAVDKFTRGLADQTVWGTDLESRDDAVVIGPSAGEVTRGKKDIKKLWAKRLELNTREIGVNQTSAGLTRDGQLIWISTVVTRAADGEDPTPLRVFAVYARDGANWTMFALDEALALDQPGSGTAFKKILPPPPPPKVEKPPPVVAVTPPPAPVKKKKKFVVDDPPPKKVVKADPVEEPPPAKKKKKPHVEVADDPPPDADPPKKKKKKHVDVADDPPADADDPPKKKKKKKHVDDDAKSDDAPQKADKTDADDPPPKKKKKKKKHVDDDDVKVDDDR